MSKYAFESIVGFCVIILCGVFLYRVYNVTTGGYDIADSATYYATFSNVEGISVGTDVKIGGLKVGSVHKINVDKNLKIVVEVRVSRSVEVPSDSSLVISSSNLLGGRYLEVKPGAEEALLKNGESFQSTRSTVNIEELISKFAFK